MSQSNEQLQAERDHYAEVAQQRANRIRELNDQLDQVSLELAGANQRCAELADRADEQRRRADELAVVLEQERRSFPEPHGYGVGWSP